jgi:hypothetical protein
MVPTRKSVNLLTKPQVCLGLVYNAMLGLTSSTEWFDVVLLNEAGWFME